MQSSELATCSIYQVAVLLLPVLLRTHFPGGSFTEINTDMKKTLRGGYTCCTPGCYSNTKGIWNSIFHIFPRIVTLREKWVNSIKRKDFILG